MRIPLGAAVELVALLSIGGGQQWVRTVAAAVEEIEAAVHDVRSRLEGVASIDPGRRVDVAGVGAILDPIGVIGTILLVHVADGVEELVVDAADADAPVGQSKSLPAGLDACHAIGAAGARTDVRPAAGTGRGFAANVDAVRVTEGGIVHELDAAHRQGEVGELVVDLLVVLRGNGVLQSVWHHVSPVGELRAVMFYR